MGEGTENTLLPAYASHSIHWTLLHGILVRPENNPSFPRALVYIQDLPTTVVGEPVQPKGDLRDGHVHRKPSDHNNTRLVGNTLKINNKTSLIRPPLDETTSLLRPIATEPPP